MPNVMLNPRLVFQCHCARLDSATYCSAEPVHVHHGELRLMLVIACTQYVMAPYQRCQETPGQAPRCCENGRKLAGRGGVGACRPPVPDRLDGCGLLWLRSHLIVHLPP